eukprot:5009378-Amphidinium_carterae.1
MGYCPIMPSLSNGCSLFQMLAQGTVHFPGQSLSADLCILGSPMQNDLETTHACLYTHWSTWKAGALERRQSPANKSSYSRCRAFAEECAELSRRRTAKDSKEGIICLRRQDIIIYIFMQ